MAASPTPNPDLEQSIFKTTLRETRLRQRAKLIAIVPIAIGAIWLLFSIFEIAAWQAHSREVEQREAEIQKRETEARQQVVFADEQRVAAEARAKMAQEQEKIAKDRTEDIENRLVGVRDEIGVLGTLLTDISSARFKASRLGASEPVEAQLVDIRKSLAGSLAKIEEAVDKGLPPEEQKSRVYLYLADDSQKAMAKELTASLEGAGYDVAAVETNRDRKVESTEVRYFHEPGDKTEAGKIQDIVEKHTGPSSAKLDYTKDSDFATGTRKFHVWFAKTPTP
jgi:hypothetical protein